MENGLNFDAVKGVFETALAQGQELIRDNEKLDALLQSLEEKLRAVPVAGTALARVPLMAAMLKSYAAKEYTDVSPKVLASIAGAFLYLIKRSDLIPDKLPLIGHLDDIAVFTLALKFIEPELNEYAAWREQREGK